MYRYVGVVHELDLGGKSHGITLQVEPITAHYLIAIFFELLECLNLDGIDQYDSSAGSVRRQNLAHK